MKRISFYVLSFFLLIVISAASFYFGGRFGFHQGYYYCTAHGDITGSALTTEVLRRMQDNRIDQAKSLLESALNNQIVGFELVIGELPSFHGLRFYDQSILLDEASITLMKRACKYRQQYPHESNKITQKTVDTVLRNFLSNEN